MLTLENQMVKSARKVDALKRQMDALKEAKVPTQGYQKLQKELDDTVKRYEELSDTVATFEKIGTDKDVLPFKQARAEAQDLYIKIEDIRGAMFELEDSGKAFSFDQASYDRLGANLQDELGKQKELNAQYDIAGMKLEKANTKAEKLPGIFQKTLTIAKKTFSGLSSAVKKVDSLLGKLANKAKSVFASITKSSNASGNSVSAFGKRIRSLLLSMLVFEQIRKGFNAVFSGIQESFKNFAKYSSQTNKVMSDLYGALATLKNALASAFAPIINIAVPYLTTLINYVTKAVGAVAQLIAALTGQTSWKRAKKQTTDYAGALDKTAASAKKAAGALAGFDDLDVLNKNDADTGVDAGGAGVADMWEDVPIDSKFMELAEKIKDILSKIFAPLLEAWNRQGKYVIEAWKYALKEVWQLIKDIGRDFLTVWNQEKTIAMFEDILIIIKDIGLAVGNLAKNFREAWNENQTGLHILENIRDIFAVIIANIREAADYTVKWADQLDFSPLLESFERLTASLVPAVDNLSGVLSDFYTMVLLPLGKWVLEKGLPDLLDVFTAFNERVDWEKLRSNLAEFWKHLEPFAERVGEGLILFIEDVSMALADFLNSEAFENFLKTVEKWMDNVDAEDVAKTLKNIAKALIALKIAVAGFKAVEAVVGIIERIGKVLSFLTGGKLAAGLTGLGTSISGAVSSLGGLSGILTTDLATVFGAGTFAEIGVVAGTAIIGGIIAAWAGWNLGQLLNEAITGEEIDMSFFEQMSAIKESFSDGSWKEALSLWAADIGSAFSEIGNSISTWWNETVVPFFSSIAGWINTNVIQPVIAHFRGLFTTFMNIGSSISGWWTGTVVPFFSSIAGWINTNVIQPVIAHFRGLFTTFMNIGSSISGWWTGTVVPFFSSIAGWINTNVIQPVIAHFRGLSTTLGNIWNSTWNAIKTVINFILGGVETMANGIVNGFNTAIKALNSLNFSAPSWVPVIGGKSFKLNIGTISGVKLPRLEEGAVFHGGNPYAAIVNDQPRGQTNVETPLSTIKQAVAEVMSSTGNNSTPCFQIFIGNEQIDDYIITAGNRGALRSGGF